jgi:RNA polymerase sigma factor (TIGR02999 family)
MDGLSKLLLAANQGDQGAVSKILEITYEQLRGLAHSRLSRGGRITELDTTSLVHECYLRLTNLEQLNAQTPAHFYAYAARVMRSIIVDLARQHSANKRHAGEFRVTLNTDVVNAAGPDEEDIIRINDALEELAAVEPRLVQVIEMRFFAGLTELQIAQCLGVAHRTVRRDWQKARMLLHVALKQ